MMLSREMMLSELYGARRQMEGRMNPSAQVTRAAKGPEKAG